MSVPGTPTDELALPPPPAPGANAVPLCLTDAIRRSLANVQTVQANVAVRIAQVARFEALKNFIPLTTLPQFMAGFSRFTPGADTVINFPDVMGFTQFSGQPPGLDHLSANRLYLLFPLDPAGQITALPIAEEGVHAKQLMEQLVRRSQVALAIQSYFEAKQIPYGIRVARMALTAAEEQSAVTIDRLRQKQAYEIELANVRNIESQARVLLANLEKNSRVAQRQLAVVLHQSRLLVPQGQGPLPIGLDEEYRFNLDDPDLVNLALLPDFPASRAEAIDMATRQRVEVRILIVGLRIARLRNQGAGLRLFGVGALPLEMSFKNTTNANHGVALGAIFAANYNPPLVDLNLWSQIRQARLDVIQSQLDLEKALVDVTSDAGNTWDRWEQAIKEWQQRESDLLIRRGFLDRQVQLYQQGQSIKVDVLGAQVNVLQADANRWTAWYSLQLAGFDVLRATELLLDYVEKAGISRIPAGQEAPKPGLWTQWLARLPWSSPDRRLPVKEEVNDGAHRAATQSPVVAAAAAADGADPAAGRVPGPERGAAAHARGATADPRLIRTSAPAAAGSPAARSSGDHPDPSGVPPRWTQPGRAPAQRPPGGPAGRPLPGRGDPAAGEPASAGQGDDRPGDAPR
jgi:outer membrane protein TolC